MKAFFVAVLLAISGGVAAAQNVEVNYSNPVMAGDYPDPSVIRVGDDYWATATSSEWSPQFPILHSKDLINWEVVGPVFEHKPRWAVGNFWAPEITTYNGLYYIYYVARKRGGPLSVAVAAASRPQGPYADYGPMVSQPAGSIDPVFIKDENGDPFLIWKEDGNSRKQPCVLWAQRLSENGIQLIGERKELLRNDPASWEGAVIEGPFIVQRGDYFYMFYSGSGCCGLNCKYALGVARSKALLGPWEKNPGNPIFAGNDDWKCPGHGSIVLDSERRYWLMYHAYDAKSFVFTGREALLDEVKFTADGWAEINMGMGASAKAPAPTGTKNPQRRSELKYSDSFSGNLKPGWNWPVSDDSPASFSNGRLVVTSPITQGTNLMGGVIGRAITAGDFTATTVIRRDAEPGVIAGLAALGDRANSTGIAVVDDQIILWNRVRDEQRILNQTEAPKKSRELHFRLIAAQGKHYLFAFSADGVNWTDIQPQTNGSHLPPWDRAVRVGMTVGGARRAEARFDSFQMEATDR